MIIDLILDRKDGKEYNAKEFYNSVSQYASTLNTGIGIAEAMDNVEEEDIKRALINYIYENDYSQKLIPFINFSKWL